MTDSSVGGKTAVDLPDGKNLMGAFWPPAAVIADTDTLNSLPSREIKAGLGEIVKYYALGVTKLKELIPTENWEQIVYECCGMKAELTTRDLYDTGDRRYLNLGHTFAHAIEKYYAYGKYNHGEAVAIGLRLALETGHRMGVTPEKSMTDILSLAESAGLETSLDVPVKELIPYMHGDKKNSRDKINLILLQGVGTPLSVPVTPKKLAEVWA
jgi:3-dehydroquinate synthase